MKDLIDRQAAIDKLEPWLRINGYSEGELNMLKAVLYELENTPSTQPEVIRCTECKHYREYDSEYVENAVVVQCMADRYPISEIIPDGWFCAGAERKDDE